MIKYKKRNRFFLFAILYVKGDFAMLDKDIVDLYWQRSETAIEKTAEKYGGYCYSIAYNILSESEDAEECVTDTWIGAWNSMPPHKPSYLSGFLAKITRRISISKWRKKRAEKRGGGEIPLSLEELSECVSDGGSFCHCISPLGYARRNIC